MPTLFDNAGAKIGSIIPYTSSVAPVGYLVCDGSTVNRSTYSKLYAVVGNAYGAGDGSTTFHLPDFRGRFLRGYDSGAGNDPDSSSRLASNSGGNTGNNVGSLQADQVYSHTHLFNNSGGVGNAVSGTQVGYQSYGQAATSSYGGNETRPKNVTVNYLIKW